MKIDPNALPAARAIQKRGNNQKANYLSGSKLVGIVQTESRLESVATYAAMIDPRVMTIQPQPLTFDLNTGRSYPTKAELIGQHSGTGYKPKPYTPDLRLNLDNGETVFVETKHTVFLLKNPDHLEMPEVLKQIGHRLLLLTEKELTETFSRNVKHLRPYAGQSLAKSALETIRELGSGPFTLSQAINRTELPQSAFLRAILSGHLKFDLTSIAIGPKTTLHAASGSTDHLEFFDL